MLDLPAVARSWSVAMLLCAAGERSHADTVWQCWYEAAPQVTCVLAQGAATGVAEDARLPAPAPAVAVASQHRAPAFVTMLHNDPGALRGQFVRIPLHSEPTDQQFVRQLVQSVMCADKAGCVAVYQQQPTGSLARLIAIADAIDPLLQARQ